MGQKGALRPVGMYIDWKGMADGRLTLRGNWPGPGFLEPSVLWGIQDGCWRPHCVTQRKRGHTWLPGKNEFRERPGNSHCLGSWHEAAALHAQVEHTVTEEVMGIDLVQVML